MVLQVADFFDHIQNRLHGFLWQKKLPPPPDIPVTIDEKPLTKVKEKRVLGVIINDNLNFASHIKQITLQMTSQELQRHGSIKLYQDEDSKPQNKKL